MNPSHQMVEKVQNRRAADDLVDSVDDEQGRRPVVDSLVFPYPPQDAFIELDLCQLPCLNEFTMSFVPRAFLGEGAKQSGFSGTWWADDQRVASEAG